MIERTGGSHADAQYLRKLSNGAESICGCSTFSSYAESRRDLEQTKYLVGSVFLTKFIASLKHYNIMGKPNSFYSRINFNLLTTHF